MRSITIPAGKRAILRSNGKEVGEIVAVGTHRVAESLAVELADVPPKPEPTGPRERPVSDHERIKQLAKFAGKTLEQLDAAVKVERAVAATAS